MGGTHKAGTRVAGHHAGGTGATARRCAAAWGLALACLAGGAPPAAAQTAPDAPQAFAAPAAPLAVLNPVQQNVPAEATAENAVLARDQALAAGRRTAWDRLAAEAGVTGRIALSDAQIERMVTSIVIEQERITPTRYAARITVNFNPSRAREALGSRAPAMGGIAGDGGAAGEGQSEAIARPAPASTWVDAIATYRSMGEWLELRRRLAEAAPVASVTVQGIAVDAARLRLGLRAPAPVAAEELAGLGLALLPPAAAPAGGAWRVGLGAAR